MNENEYQPNCKNCNSLLLAILYVIDNDKESVVRLRCSECGTILDIEFKEQSISKTTKCKKEISYTG